MLRVFIPYALFETVLIPYYGDFNVVDYLLDITCLQPRYWYFGVLLIGYFAFWLCIINKKCYRLRYLILCAFALAVFFLKGALYAEQAASFMIGVLVSDNYEKAKKAADNNLILSTTAIVAIVLLVAKQLSFVRAVEGTYLYYLIQMTMKLSMGAFLIILTYKLWRLFYNGLIIWCGTVSMECYLIHYRMLRLFEASMPVMLEIILFVLGTFLGVVTLNLCIKQLTRIEKKMFES